MIDRDPNCVEAKVIYQSVREEILDQKRCQFQIFGAALTFSATVLAYGVSHNDASPYLYAAPMIMNVMTLMVIMDKAISIQRMVGYLQLMESIEPPSGAWMWEYHLNLFRDLDKPGSKDKPESKDEPESKDKPRDRKEDDFLGKHRYVFHVSSILMMLNTMFLLLYFFRGTDGGAFRRSLNYEGPERCLWIIDLLIIAVNTYGVYVAVSRLRRLTRGSMTSVRVRACWMRVFRDDEKLEPAKVLRKESVSVAAVGSAQSTGTDETVPFPTKH